MKLIILLLLIPFVAPAQGHFPGDVVQAAKIIHADGQIKSQGTASILKGHIVLEIWNHQYSCDSAALKRNLLTLYGVTKTEPPLPFKQCQCDSYTFDLKTSWMTCNCN